MTPKELILRALRSGDYRKTRDKLYMEDETGCYYCVLGVVCDVYMKAHGISGWERVDWDTYYPKGMREDWMTDFDLQVLPEQVAQWAFGDKRAKNPEVKLEEWGDRDGLAALNDSGYSFDQIALAMEDDDYLWGDQ